MEGEILGDKLEEGDSEGLADGEILGDCDGETD
jgi:hypothetical protein